MKYSLKTKISTPKYQETRSFYERVFEMIVVEEWGEPGDVGAILGFSGGLQEAFLEVYDVDVEKEFDGLSLQFRVDSIADFQAALPDHIKFEGPTERPWGSTYLYLRDPNDIQVIVYEGGL
jgi:catechol 2,3-dioxygenase-like lactoylglutathione lyase family enzyme